MYALIEFIIDYTDNEYNVIDTNTDYIKLYNELNNLLYNVIDEKIQTNMLEMNETIYIKNLNNINEFYQKDKVSNEINRFKHIRIAYLEHYYDNKIFNTESNLYIIVKI
jgi:hypothetical protein